MRSCRTLLSSTSSKSWNLSSCDATQVSYLGERCIEVDEQDNVLNPISKGDAHRSSSLTLHRAFSVFCFTPAKKLILQKRSLEKITFPGLWANTCCSHPLHNERELDGVFGVKRAAVRKLKHELGIEGMKEEEMTEAGRFVYRSVMKDGEWGEHEMDYALVVPNVACDRIQMNPNEVSDVCDVSYEELIDWVRKDPDAFSPWLQLFSRNPKLALWWKSLDNVASMVQYHVSRSSRLMAYWSALPRRMLKKYPEQTIFYATFGLASVVMGAYKLQKFGTEGVKPWYRSYYDVVRPDDPVLKTWRKPEEYPAPYLSDNGFDLRMHSLYSRANALFAFTLWVMAAVTAACFLSTGFVDYNNASVEITFNNPKVRSVVDYASEDERVDQGILDFSIKGDFSDTFNWNVKQLFVYLVAEYKSKNNELNQVVLWDRIIERSRRVVIDERQLKPKYYFMDDGTNLLNHPNVTLVLRYNVVPNAGYLRLAQAENQVIVKFPGTYTTSKN
ncbi:unnamed protein product [Caenorhabditis auriculariae]|uniref:isopentenyl-diphosphate Delta-isomerase n=1 Tax=Caenorhabditis auriculariae TaxID=2777116 RepID=A0A8S1H0I9_9PELO|nr:unnamed protein product [Caenorhabditis auriculariae]